MKKAIVFVLGFLPVMVFSQSFYAMQRPRNLAVSAGLGSSLYFGELMKSAPLNAFKLLKENRVRYTVVGSAELFLYPRFSIRSEVSVFRLSETDQTAKDDSRSRNLNFRSTNTELSIIGAYNLFPLPMRFDKRLTFNAHIFAGIGVFSLNPKTTLNGKTYSLREWRTEGQDKKYSRISTSIPLGAGFRFRTTMTTSLVVEAGYRFTFTDYLDDISGIQDSNEPTKGRYPTIEQLGNDPTGERLALSDRRREYNPRFEPEDNEGVRGDPTTKDGYFLFNIKFEYYLPLYVINMNKADRRIRNIKPLKD